MGAADDPFEDDEKDDKEHEGYYPRDGETEDELFLHDLHRYGYEKYKDSDISPDRRNNYNGYYNPYTRGGYNYNRKYKNFRNYNQQSTGDDGPIAEKKAERAEYEKRKQAKDEEGK